MSRSQDQQAGFTLIEAAIAALIMLIAIVFVAQMFVTAMQQNRASRRYTHATAVAQSKLEELNAVPIGQLRYGGDLGEKDVNGNRGADGFRDYVAVDAVDNDKIGVVKDKAEASYARYWRIDPDPDAQAWHGVYRITVRVVSLKPAVGTLPEEAVVSTIRSVY